MRLLSFLPLALSIACAAAPSLAQEATPTRTTATYGDWLVRCETVGEQATKPLCETVQAIAAANGQGIIAQIVVGKPAGEDQYRLFAELPAGVWLPDGVNVALSPEKTVTLSFKRCVQTCLADVLLEPADLEALIAASTPGTLSFKDGARAPVTLPISFKGFADAFKASSDSQ